MKKRLLASLLSLCLLVGLFPTVALAAAEPLPTGNQDGQDTVFWGAADQTAQYTGGTVSGGIYTLAGDVVLVEQNITISGSVTIDLAGHDLIGTKTGSTITVPSGATLTLKDSSSDAVGVLSGGEIPADTKDNWKYGGGVTVDGGTFVMEGGKIKDGAATCGGGVNVSNGGTFIMTGGQISKNTSGGGLYVTGANSTATIRGTAKITENSNDSDDPYGIHVIDEGKVTLADNAEIVNNGHGVMISSATFEMTGGVIAGNQCAQDGGGVYVIAPEVFSGKPGTFTMSGGTIEDNTGINGGGVTLAADQEGTVSFTMTGGQITNNTAHATNGLGGGGVFYDGGTFTVSGSPKITGNKQGDKDNNVRLNTGLSITNNGLTNGAAIGVTTEAAPTEGNPVTVLTGSTTPTLSWISSDDPTYEPAVSGNDIVLQYKEPVVSQDDIKRDEVAEKIHKHEPFGLPATSQTNITGIFSDLNDCTDDQKTAIAVLYDQKIVSGKGDGTFSPDETITRGQAAVMIWRAAGSKTLSGDKAQVTCPYTDISSTPYHSSIYWLYAVGILDDSDMTNGEFAPNRNATKADIEKWLNKYTSNLVNGLGASAPSGATTRADFLLTYYTAFSDSLRKKGMEDPDEDFESKFIDLGGCTEEQKEAVYYFEHCEIIYGYKEPAGCFGPHDAVSNMDVAEFARRLAQYDDPQPAMRTRAAQSDPFDFLVEQGVLSEADAQTLRNSAAPALSNTVTTWVTKLRPDTPTASVAAGTYTSAQSVTLSTTTEGAEIYYTTDGSDPTLDNGTPYSAPIAVSSSMTIKAIAVNNNLSSDGVMSVSYTINSGGSSGGSSSTTTETTKNPDGSTTTTTTDKKTGTVTEVTKNTDGSTETVETKKDGTVTTTTKAADGSSAKVIENADGTTEIEASVSKAAVREAEKSGTPVALPLEVAPSENASNAPDVEVSLPAADSTVAVSINVKNITPGTVAMLVGDDGTTEVIRKSVADDDEIVIPLDGSATVKIVNNEKEFTDTDDHWAEGAIDFVTARELYAGTSATTFSPDNTMTRAMLARVLHNLEGNPGHSFEGTFSDLDDHWATDSIHWAADKGIVGGYPDGSYGADNKITREQLAVMLWRYAGSPDSSHDLSHFNDAENISSYARTALAWANENGIVGGVGNNTMSPQGNATRAQVATMLMRMMQNTF